MKEVTGPELAAELAAGNQPLLLDVREPHELEISKLPGVLAIPMGEVPARLAEVPKDADIVVICRSGGRSGQITQFLTDQGYGEVRNLIGGMNGWADLVDPTVSKY